VATHTEAKPKIEKSPPKRPFLALPLEGLALIVTFLSILGFFGSFNCFIDLLAHFRVQYAIALAGAMALALLVRTWRAVALGGIGLATNLAVIVPLFLPPGGTLDENIPPLKIVSFNVLYANQQFDDVADYLLEEQADVILLLEADNNWISAIAAKLEGYRLVDGDGEAVTFGIALFVRDASTDLVVGKHECRDITGGLAQAKAILTHLQWHDQPLAFLGMHTCTPVTEPTALRRDAELEAAARWSQEQQSHGNAVLAIGDFNATPWSYAFRKLETEGSLLNSQRGFGVQASFKSTWPVWLGIPIDHCLHSQELKIVQRRVDPQAHGSDHRPLVVEVGWIE